MLRELGHTHRSVMTAAVFNCIHQNVHTLNLDRATVNLAWVLLWGLSLRNKIDFKKIYKIVIVTYCIKCTTKCAANQMFITNKLDRLLFIKPPVGGRVTNVHVNSKPITEGRLQLLAPPFISSQQPIRRSLPLHLHVFPTLCFSGRQSFSSELSV